MENVSAYEFTFIIVVTFIISVFVPERSRAGTNPLVGLYQHVTIFPHLFFFLNQHSFFSAAEACNEASMSFL